MNLNIKKTVAAAVLLMGLAPSAFAGGVQIDNKSLTDVLVEKGILTQDDVKGVSKNNDGKLKLEATVFADMTQESKTTAGTRVKTIGLTASRAYLTAKYSFNSDWMMRVTTDVSAQTNLNSKNNNIFLKYAYLQGKLVGDAAVLRIGQSHTPWIDHEEHLWGHRYVSPVMIDKNGYDASSDLGLGLKGKLADNMVNYFVTATNGAGYSRPVINQTGTTRNNALDYDARIGLNVFKGLTIDGQYRTGYKGKDKSTAPKVTLSQAMLTYGMGHDFRVGLNYATNKSAPQTGASTTEKAAGLWGWGKFADKFGVFGRYEQRDFGVTAKAKQKRILAGVEYLPTKGVNIALVVDNTKDLAGTVGDKDNKIGLYSQFAY